MFTRLRQRLTSWIAIAAVIFASLAPTISHAFPAKNNQPTLLQELCGAHGAKQFIAVDLAVNTEKAPSKNQVAMHFEHCPYCANHVANFAITTDSITLFLAEINSVQRIELYVAPRVQSYYPVSHPSHAPPLV